MSALVRTEKRPILDKEQACNPESERAGENSYNARPSTSPLVNFSGSIANPFGNINEACTGNVIEELKEEKPNEQIDKTALHEKIGSVKEKTFISDEIVVVGESWKMVELIDRIKGKLIKSFFAFNRSRYMLIIHLLYFLCTLGNCTISFLSFLACKHDDDLIVLGALYLFNVGFMVSVLIFVLIHAAKLVCKQWISMMFIRMVMSLRIINLTTSIVIALSLYPFHRSYSLAMLSLACAAGFTYLLLFAAGLLVSPFICLGFIAEAFIRMFKCKLGCPRQEKKRKDLKYQLFNYSTKVFGDSECVVCLTNFEENDAIVVLQCHDSHIFHENCIMEWMTKSLYCPVCRKDVEFILN
eukprot:TRINITY_DN6070_c0_g1_i29.p1 TRINITY_DN6070_c0_g1~~TRINITY_DN6070_c0_g1_i29.p1  ORF type:complete len:355 (-),score=57.48 TRINITY_DN6070_c0_g1_i29:171-1235(-)